MTQIKTDKRRILNKSADTGNQTHWNSIYVATILSFIGSVQFNLYISVCFESRRCTTNVVLGTLAIHPDPRPRNERKLLCSNSHPLLPWTDNRFLSIWTMVKQSKTSQTSVMYRAGSDVYRQFIVYPDGSDSPVSKAIPTSRRKVHNRSGVS